MSALRLLVRSTQTLLLLGLLSAAFPTESVAATACGGDGERGCCIASTERLSTGACASGLVEEPGCTGDCACQGSGFASWFGSSSSGTCRLPTACGGDGQRACCATTGEFRWNDNPIPASGGCAGSAGGGTDNLTELAGTSTLTGSAVCGGDNPFGWKSNGTCVPCGSDGAHICVGGDTTLETECKPGLSKDAFGYCSVCGGDGESLCVDDMCNVGYHPDSGVCVKDRLIAPEPDCNCTPDPLATPDPQQPVVGYADLHLHMFSNLAFGGMVVWGDAYDPILGVSGALRADNFVQRNVDYQINGHAQTGINNTTLEPDFFRGMTLLHGDNHFNDLINFGQGTLPLHSNAGVEWDPNYLFGDFIGWPQWGSVTHQQAYFTWLQRAHRGGMRLTVMLGVTNEAMCAAGRHLDYPELECAKTMTSIKLQLRKARWFQAWNDEQCGIGYGASQDPDPSTQAKGLALVDRHCAQGGGPTGTGWFRIVKDPAAARVAIANGQLAVVLGIEESTLFGFKVGLADGNFDELEKQLQEFHDLGVRHVFPIHNFDNAFGGTATWNETIGVGHRYANRHVADWLEVEGCPVTPALDGYFGYGYSMYAEPLLNGFLGAATFGIDIFTYPNGDTIDGWPQFQGTCNVKGLTSFGEGLIERLIDIGMIIDIDHMSNKSFDKTLEIAETHAYPGIVASHALMYDLHVQDDRHERMRTQTQLERIAALGGMIGVMTQPPENEIFDGRHTVDDPAGSIVNDCEMSSKTFAAAYEWAVKVMDPVFPNGQTFGVAFGTDFNGISKHNAPRFGIEGCALDTDAAVQSPATMVQYPFTMPGFGTFDKQQTSQRVFNFNTDGLAHIGLLPDMVQDMKNVGLDAPGDLDPLFNSAEAYLQMWEGTIAVADTVDIPPVVNDTIPPQSRALVNGAPLGYSDWFTSATTVVIDSADAAGGSGVSGIDLSEREDLSRPLDNTGWTAYQESFVNQTSTSVSYSTEGLWQLSHRAQDFAGNQGGYRKHYVGLDWTPPTLTNDVSSPPNANGWYNTLPTVTWTCSDNLSDLSNKCPDPYTPAQEGVDEFERTITDRAGNTSDPAGWLLNVDLTLPIPRISFLSEFPPSNGWFRADVTYAYVCFDSLSGVDTCPPDETITAERARQQIVVQATDLAGNLWNDHPQDYSLHSVSAAYGLDKTPPTLTFTVASGPGADEATVTPTCSDALSGLNAYSVSTSCVPKLVSTLGADPMVTLQARDEANNLTEVEVHIFDEVADTEPPTISNYPFSSGWLNIDNNIRFYCDDDRTVASCGPDQIVSTEGANQTVQGVAIDEAGNQSAPLVVGPINIDKTPPMIAIDTVTPRPDLPYSAYDVTFVCSDALSGISSCSPLRTVTSYNQTSITVSAQDNATNRTDLVVNWADVHTPDTTPPTIVASLVPPANAAGWVNAGSVVHYDCADAVSGVFFCTGDQTIFQSEVGQTRQGQVTDKAGNGPVVAQITYNADVTLPEIAVATMTVTGPDEVTATFSCSDDHSGIDACEGPMVLGTNPPAVGIATASDLAGNLTTTEVSSEGADLVPPTIDHVIVWQTPSQGVQIHPNPPDWIRSGSYWVRWICDDDQPGVTCSPDSPIHTLPDAPNQALTGEAVDASGNRVTKTVTVNKDSSYPVVSVTQSPPSKGPSFSVWYNQDVEFQYDCADPHSGIEACSSPTVAAGEGGFIEMPYGEGTNNAGLTSHPSNGRVDGWDDPFNIDKTPPTLAAAIVGYDAPPNLKVDVACSDPLPAGVNFQSGLQDCHGQPTLFHQFLLDASAPGPSAVLTATDTAGNVATLVLDYSAYQYNTTPPQVTVVASPAPNAAGWNRTDVDIDVTCVDPENQMDTCSQDTQLTNEGAGQTFDAFGIDDWQNRTDISYGPVNIDKTPPSILPGEGPGPNPWQVSVSFACSDAVSGVATCEAPFDIELGYGDIPVSGTVTDLAGYSTTAPYVVDGCQRSCDADCNGYVDERDIAEIDAADGESVDPGDVRDPDDDGVITSNDSALCTNECDSAFCAETGGPSYYVPEPGVVLSLGAGWLALAALARVRRRRAAMVHE